MSSSNRVDFLRSNRALSELDFFNLLQETGKYKKRSEITHDTVHKPLLSQLPATQIRCLLLGDSMLERFITTGKHTKLGQLAFPNLLNAGVGGDRIQNVVYRLGTKDLFSGLKQRGVKFAILHMGTNNLRRNRGLTGGEIEQYAMVLEALTRAAPDIVVFVTGIMPRTDIGSNFVNQSNTDLRQLVQGFNAIGESTQGMPCLNSPHIPMLHCTRKIRWSSCLQTFPVHYVPPSPGINLDKLVDHVHLNEEGYALFAQSLLEKMDELGLEL